MLAAGCECCSSVALLAVSAVRRGCLDSSGVLFWVNWHRYICTILGVLDQGPAPPTVWPIGGGRDPF